VRNGQARTRQNKRATIFPTGQPTTTPTAAPTHRIVKVTLQSVRVASWFFKNNWPCPNCRSGRLSSRHCGSRRLPRSGFRLVGSTEASAAAACCCTDCAARSSLVSSGSCHCPCGCCCPVPASESRSPARATGVARRRRKRPSARPRISSGRRLVTRARGSMVVSVMMQRGWGSQDRAGIEWCGED